MSGSVRTDPVECGQLLRLSGDVCVCVCVWYYDSSSSFRQSPSLPAECAACVRVLSMTSLRALNPLTSLQLQLLPLLLLMQLLLAMHDDNAGDDDCGAETIRQNCRHSYAAT